MHVSAARAVGLFVGAAVFVVAVGWVCGANKGAQIALALVGCAGILVYLFGSRWPCAPCAPG